MLFDITFEVIELRKSGARITHYLKGSKKAVLKDVEMYKKQSKSYQMIGKNGMIVWVD